MSEGLSQTVSSETPQSPPAFDCLGHNEPARYCDAGGMDKVWRYSLVLRSYSAHIPLVLPLYTRANFSRPSVPPPSPSPGLTSLVWPIFKGDEHTSELQSLRHL